MNFKQTPLSYISLCKYNVDLKDLKTGPTKSIDGKRLVTATFAISMSGEFLPIQVIYQCKTKRCLDVFTDNLDMTVTEYYWCNTEKYISFLRLYFLISNVC